MQFLLQKIALICVLALLAPVAHAVPTPGEQDLIRDRQDRLLEEQGRRLQELKDLPGEVPQAVAPAAPADTRCFTITRIELKGADSLSVRERDALLKPFQGKCLGVAQLNDILKVITDHYLDKGQVTTRAYLPQQDLSGGVLQVLVVEGKLEHLKSEAGSELSPRELAMAFPGSEGQRLNLREIEQLLEQLNRLPSNQAKMELTPGAEVGGSDVLVKNTAQKPWRASLARHNDGQQSTGEQQWGAGLDWDSPLGLADQLNLRGGWDALSDHRQTSNNGMLAYSLPWGWWTFNYSYSQSDYRAIGQAVGVDFKLTGDSQNHQLGAERVIHRDGVSKTSISTGLGYQRINNYVEDSRLASSSTRLAEARFGINHGRRMGSAFVNLDLGMQHGIGAFDAQSRGNPQGGEPDARYRKYTGTLSYLQPFTLWSENFSFSSLATGQRSEDVLFSAQRISLGGSSSVRGYKEQFLSGDSGGYWRNELRLTRPVNLDGVRLVFAEYGAAAGYDQGVIRNDRYNGSDHGRVSSNSLELFARGQHLAAAVTFAHSLERPDGIIEREAPVYFRVDLFL